MLPRWSVEHPIAAAMLVLAFVALGFISILRLGMELYPRIDLPAISIVSIYPGASPTDVEEKLTKVIEEAVSGIPGVKEVSSDSSENVSSVVVMLNYGTNVQESLNKIRDELDKVKRFIPKEVENPTIGAFDLSAFPTLSMALYGDLPLHQISNYARENLENALKRVDGVASVNISGQVERKINIDLDPAKLRQTEVTPDQVAGAIALYDSSMPLGKIENDDKALSIRLSGNLKDINFIKNIIVRPYIEYEEMPSQKEIAGDLRRAIQRQVTQQLEAVQRAQQEQMRKSLQVPGIPPAMTGQPQSVEQPKITFSTPQIKTKKKSLSEIKISQIANVYESDKASDLSVRINQRPAVFIRIHKSDEANTVKVVDDIKAVLQNQKAEFPDGLKYAIFSDQAKEIQASIGGTSRGALYAAVLAVIVLLVFLRSVRSTLIIALSIPASVVSTFLIIYFSGFTLNMVTIGGLALGIGMLVDNSIVVLENIFRHMENGIDPKEAAKIGGQEVAGAITASTLTSIGVFLPIIFISGMAKEWLGPLAIVVISSLAFSLLIALTLVPLLASKFYGRGYMRNGKKRKAISLKGFYRPIIIFALKYRYAVILIMVALVGGSAFAARTIGAIMMPTGTTQEIVYINVEMPPWASNSASQKVAKTIEDVVLSKVDGIQDISTSVGGGAGMFGEKPPAISISLWLKPETQRKYTLGQTVDLTEKELSSIKAAKEIIVRGGSTGIAGGNQSAIGINVSGPSLTKLEQIVRDLTNKIKNVNGIGPITTSLDESKPEYIIQVDYKKSMEDSVSLLSIANLIRIATNGQEVSKLRSESGEESKVVLSMSKVATDIDLLKGLKIQTKDEYQPIGNYINITEGQALSSIYRYNKNRTMNISIDIDKEKTTISDKSKEIQKIIDKTKLPPGYSFSYGGEMEDMVEVFRQLGEAMIIALILIYMLMAAQFGSLKNPLIIMFTVPLAAIGVVTGLKLSSTPFSMIVFLGLITLAGIVVNNGIVLIDFISTLRKRGLKVDEAILSAGLLRVRPIIMTAATTVLAMAPVGFNIGGKQMMAPMAITIMGGLTFSTVLSLIFIPAIYSIINRDKLETNVGRLNDK